MQMSDTEKVRVNLAVHEETKEKWDDAAEESPEYSSLSDLIRQSVAYELSDTQDAAPRTADGREVEQPAQAEALERVTDTLTRMENTLSDLDDRLSNVEKEVTATARADLKNQVFDALPEYKSSDQLDGDESQEGKSADDIAEEIGANRERVYNVIQQLEDQTGAIREVMNIEGQQYWARDE